MTIKAGLVGYGSAGKIFHEPLIRSVDGLTLTNIITSKGNIDDLLLCPEIDVVVIATPNSTHYDFAKRAVCAGKHVVVEKPFTVNSEDGEELIRLAKEKSVILTVFHNRRWDSEFLKLRELIRNDVLGDILTYESHFDRFRPQIKDRWKENDTPGGGVLYDLGSHLIDQALVLFGKPKTVHADVRIEREGGLSDDYFYIVLSYEKTKVILRSSSLVKEPGPKLIVQAEKESFIHHDFDNQEEQLKNGLPPIERGYKAFYVELLTAITGQGDPPVDPQDALEVIKIIEKVKKS